MCNGIVYSRKNSNIKARNPKQYQMTKIQMTKTVLDLENLNFEFVSNFDIRISDLFYPPSQKTTTLVVDECEVSFGGCRLGYWRITLRSFSEGGYNWHHGFSRGAP